SACQGLSPGIDDHRVSEVDDAARAAADLVGGDEIYLVLDGAGAQQYFPVCRPGRKGKRRRHDDDLRSSQCELPVQLRKAEVVADRHADDSQLGGCADDGVTGAPRLRLPNRDVAGDVDVEQMQLAVAGDDLAVGVEEHAGVKHGGVAALLEDGAGEQM